MARLEIRRDPKDGALRKRSKEIRRINAKARRLLEDMKETMYAEKGFGLSAVQVGVLRRMFVIDCGAGFAALINPTLVETAGKQWAQEGCLSIPGVFGRVGRPERVVVCAFDSDGRKVRMEFSGLSARVVCHEIDHLDGILFVDKAVPGSLIRRNEIGGQRK